MINKMDKRRKVKTTNSKNIKGLRRETNKVKEVYVKEICDEIMDLQRKGRFYLIYKKAQQLGRISSKTIRTYRIQDNKVT